MSSRSLPAADPRSRGGLFQAAARGTLFLDELGLLPALLQAKLLKVVEQRAVRRLGSLRPEPVDVAIVAAAAGDLLALTRNGRFRPDLYYRLAVVPLTLPPLRTRGDDILRLAEQFLAQACAAYAVPPRALAPSAREMLLAARWPGNVRQLANVMERLALSGEGRLVTGAMLELVDPDQSLAQGDPTRIDARMFHGRR